MFIPYHTDAPAYHWPVVTLTMIAANIYIFVCQSMGQIDDSQWMLAFDGQLHPSQWLTHHLVHLNVIHLIGNLFFLWPFGLVVEGKVGWWRFLLIYFGIGLVMGVTLQAAMGFLSTTAAGTAGASGVIFGLIGIAWVWAPRNEISCVFFLFPIRLYEFEISVLMYGTFLVCVELFFVIWGHASGSELLHLFGCVIGIAMGFAMLKFKLVDCEGYDVISVFRGREGKAEESRQEQIDVWDTPQDDTYAQEAARTQIAGYLRRNNPQAALRLMQRLSEQDRPVELDEKLLRALIAVLHKQRQWKESAKWMAQLLERFDDPQHRVRLKLAQICVVELERPARAMELFESIDPKELTDQSRHLFQMLIVRAKHMIADGAVELDDDQW